MFHHAKLNHAECVALEQLQVIYTYSENLLLCYFQGNIGTQIHYPNIGII